MLLIRVFQTTLSGCWKGGGEGGRYKILLVLVECEILLGLGVFSGGERLRRITFDHSSLFQSKKTTSFCKC